MIHIGDRSQRRLTGEWHEFNETDGQRFVSCHFDEVEHLRIVQSFDNYNVQFDGMQR